MKSNQGRGHAALRRGRFSQSEAEYFLTICTEAKHSGLDMPSVAKTVFAEAHAMSADGTWGMQCAVVMPDHLHLLVTLGRRLSLARSIQRLKAKTSASLRAKGLSWERGFFDRQLRPDDNRMSLFLYIYLNPYRAGLMERSGQWPHYYCREEEWLWFRDMLDADLPHPEWLL